MADPEDELLLRQLTELEKVSLTAGRDLWHTVPVPRLEIPSIRMSDGPNGVRGTRFFNSVPSACLPCATALGSTFDTQLLYKVGYLLAEECKSKGAHILLGPTINIQRGPLGGRGFESFSEDPYLSGTLAGHYCKGLEEENVMATVKHFVCNDQEHDRMGVNSIVSQRALREIYLMPFMLSIKMGQPACLMTSYNKVNDVHAAESSSLIDIVRQEWKWRGLIMSDWQGTYSCSDSINAGQDLEMPGPTRWRGDLLEHALRSKKVKPHILDDRVRAVLDIVRRAKKSGIAEGAVQKKLNREEDRKLLRQAAAESIVLLKNQDDILPFRSNQKVAVIGPNAKLPNYAGGGSATLEPYYTVSPWQGFSTACPDAEYSVGAHASKYLPLLDAQMRSPDGNIGFRFRAFDKPANDSSRKELDRLHLTSSNLFMLDYEVPKHGSAKFYVELDGIFTPEEEGSYDFGLVVQGYGQLFIDDRLVVDNTENQKPGEAFFGAGTSEEVGSIELQKGKSYQFRTTFATPATRKGSHHGGLRVGCDRGIEPEKAIEDAVKLASSVEQTVVSVGLTSDWESEAFDRPDMDLPGSYTDKLIRAVLKANPKAVIVIHSGTPVTMPWVDDAKCIVQAWYGGNEAGNGLVDILFGDVNPSGKLSLSFPRHLSDNPSYLNWGSERRRVLYGEDVYVGYRYYDTVSRPALFPFGYGLSYTTFKFSNLRTQRSSKITNNGTLTVTVDVANTGLRFGADVIQVYISPLAPSIKRPVKELKGFQKVRLDAGQILKDVEISMEEKYAFSFWDEEREAWIMECGKYDVLVGNSSQGEFLRETIEVRDTMWWNGL